MPAITRTKNVIARRIHRSLPTARHDTIGPPKLACVAKRHNSIRAHEAPLGDAIRSSNAFITIPADPGLPTAKPSGTDNLKDWRFAIKDNICTTDLPTSCASAMLKDYRSPFDATVVDRLKELGATIVGKTNMDEFGMGSNSTHSHFGPVRRKGTDGSDYSAGGSSGGSAIAMAEMPMYRGALGTDTGGSVRLPAAYTGVGGFKPSYGTLSRWGVVPYANSLDTVGIFSHLAHALPLFSKLDFHDPKDPTSLSPYTRARIRILYESNHVDKRPPWMDYKHLRIGIPQEYIVAELTPEVREAWATTLRSFQARGHTLVPVSLPTTKLALSAYYVIAPAEASSNLAKYDGVRYGTRSEGPDGADGLLFSKTRGEGFGDEVKRRILLGSYTLSADAIDNYFIQAQKVRRLVQQDFDRVFRQPNVLNVDDLSTGWKEDGVDILVCPTAPTLPPSLAEVEQMSPLQAYVNDVFTVPASLAGLPAISMPYRRTGHVDEPSRIGIQMIGQFGMDPLVCRVAQQADLYQKNSGYQAAQNGVESLKPETSHQKIIHSRTKKSAKFQWKYKPVVSTDDTPPVNKAAQKAPRVDKVQAWANKQLRKDLPDMPIGDYFKTLANAKLKSAEAAQAQAASSPSPYGTSAREVYGKGLTNPPEKWSSEGHQKRILQQLPAHPSESSPMASTLQSTAHQMEQKERTRKRKEKMAARTAKETEISKMEAVDESVPRPVFRKYTTTKLVKFQPVDGVTVEENEAPSIRLARKNENAKGKATAVVTSKGFKLRKHKTRFKVRHVSTAMAEILGES